MAGAARCGDKFISRRKGGCYSCSTLERGGSWSICGCEICDESFSLTGKNRRYPRYHGVDRFPPTSRRLSLNRDMGRAVTLDTGKSENLAAFRGEIGILG